MKRGITVLLLSASLLAGCATGYQSIDDAWPPGGYTETRLAPFAWRVSYAGNSFSTRAEIEQLMLRRCAELSLEQGKRYFELQGHEAWITRRRVSKDTVVRFPSNEAVVIAVDGNSHEAFDAIEIVAETDDLAKGRLSARAKATMDSIKSKQS